MTKIGVLIPTFNRIEKLKQGLEVIENALESVEYRDSFEIIVIDDGSTDGTSNFISKRYPYIILLFGDGNLWWSGAINVGARYCAENNYDGILLWNDDILPCLDYFDKLYKIIEKSNQYTIFGSTIYDKKTHKIWFAGAHYFKWIGIIKHIHKPKSLSVNCLTGMGTYVPIPVIKEIGYWDNTRFPQYYGDTDFTLSAYEKGYSITIYDELKIENDTTSSSFNQEKSIKKYWKSLFLTQSRYNLKKDILFHKKHAKCFTWVIGFFLKHLKYLISNIM